MSSNTGAAIPVSTGLYSNLVSFKLILFFFSFLQL
jgi:hypothetical protein